MTLLYACSPSDWRSNSKLAALARVRGRTKSEVVREAILRMIEDTEDLEMAEKALRKTRSPKSLRRLRKELGLDR